MNKTFLTLPILFVFLPVSHLCATSLTPSSPYKAEMRLHKVYETVKKSAGAHELENIPTITIKGRVRNVGFVDARFSIRRNKTWSATTRKNGIDVPDSLSPVLLQGSLAAGGAWKRSGERIFPSAASIIGNTAKLTFPGRATGKNRSRQRLYTITMKLDGSLVVKASIASIPRSAGKRGACGAAVGVGSLAHTHDSEHDSLTHDEVVAPVRTLSANEGTSRQLARVVTISTDGDEEWYQRYGEQSNAVIASIVNSAEAIFNRQLQIRFRIVRQHVYADSSPYTLTDPSKLLASFAKNPENRSNLGDGTSTFHKDVDLKHLFTGKDLDGTTIGIAYIGAVCAFPSMAFGVTQAYSDVANYAIFAHELGHNFGANHDISSPSGLMYPAISVPPAQGFSDATLNEISAHVALYGTCISLEEVEPMPGETPSTPPEEEDPSTIPASVSLQRSRVRYEGGDALRLSGLLQSLTSLPISGVGIRLMVDDEEIGRAVTGANGKFNFFVRLKLPQERKVSVYVRTEGVEIRSNELFLGTTRTSS